MMPLDDTSRLVIISGPSGVGKSTVVKQLLKQCDLPLQLSVSATTRPPRPGERHGVDYHFLTPEQFQDQKAAGEMLECFEVYGRGHWYGTPKTEVASGLQAGKWVILEIDVNGALQVIQQYPAAISLFILPDSPHELERRLRGRATEEESVIERRLEVARAELKLADRYRFQVINDDIDRAVAEICEILKTQQA